MKIFKVNFSQERIFGLDLLRFLAIIMVILSHGRHLLNSLKIPTEFMSIGGFWGVELFFVLSGFLIGGILIKIYDNGESFNKTVLINFWKRRWFRTLPNYYLILLLNIIIAISLKSFDFSDWRNYAFIIFFQNFVTQHPHFFEEAWSLAVEEWFYLSFPIILYCLTRFIKGIKNKKNLLLVSILSIFIVCLLLRIYSALELNPNWDSGIRKITPLRLDSILTGVFFAWLKFYYRTKFNKYRLPMLFFSFFLIIFSCYIYFNDVMNNGLNYSSIFSKTFYFSITSIGFGLLLPFSSYNKAKRPTTLINKSITLISLISYSMYLIHFSFILKGMNLFTNHNTNLFTGIIYFIFYLSTTILLSILLFKYFENPMTYLRDHTSNEKNLFLKIKDFYKMAVIELKKNIN